MDRFEERKNNLMLTEDYLGTKKSCGLNRLITVKGKYFCVK